MTSRQTNNSLDAALSAIVSSGSNSIVSTSSPSSLATSLPSEPVVVSSSMTLPSGLNTALSPEMAAFISRAVQAAVLASQRHLEPATSSAVSSPMATLATSSSIAPLSGMASSFLAAGTGFQSSRTSSSSQGRNASVVVPSFISTFNAPVPALASSAAHAFSGVAASLPSSNLNPLAEQPFVVGPGFSPVPAKLVTQILSGKFVDLADLLASNMVNSEPEPQLLLDGRLVLTTPPKKSRRRIEDIATWTEAFTVFCLVLTSSFPHRWKDLNLYKLLILRIHRQFSGRVWLTYDRAFREHAAATRLVDWSAMNVQLFNFHAAGASLRSPYSGLSTDTMEPQGSNSSTIPCMSWNKGRCTAPYASCRYYHRCSTCGGAHRSVSCNARPERKPDYRSKHRSRSPAVVSSPHNKSRRL